MLTTNKKRKNTHTKLWNAEFIHILSFTHTDIPQPPHIWWMKSHTQQILLRKCISFTACAFHWCAAAAAEAPLPALEHFTPTESVVFVCCGAVCWFVRPAVRCGHKSLCRTGAHWWCTRTTCAELMQYCFTHAHARSTFLICLVHSSGVRASRVDVTDQYKSAAAAQMNDDRFGDTASRHCLDQRPTRRPLFPCRATG